jgi:hypothetical protein
VASQLYSSALGTGGPSDWEHFGGPPPEMSPEATSPPPRMQATATPGFDAPMHNQKFNAPGQAAQQMIGATFESPAPMHATLSSTPNPEPVQAPTKVNSNQSSFRSDGIKRTGTIDSVIQAWNAPLKLPPKSEAQTDSRPVSQGSAQARAQTPAPAPVPVQERIVEVEKVVEKVIDPYDDLEPEVKASLKRYAAMLRKESAAETDEDKFSIFEAFVTKELRVRSIMYGVEPKLKVSKDEPNSKDTVLPNPAVTTSSAPTAHSPESKAPDAQLAMQPKSTDTATVSRVQPEPAKEVKVPSPLPQDMSKPQLTQSRKGSRPTTPTPIQIPPSTSPRNGIVNRSDANSDELEFSPGGRPRVKNRITFAMADGHNGDGDFSPGGRPRVKKPTNIVTSRPDIAKLPPLTGTQMSPGANAPMVLEDYAMPGLPSPSANAPIIIEPPSATDLPQVVTPRSSQSNRPTGSPAGGSRTTSTPVIKFEPARPAYMPFKYNPNVEAPKLPPEQSYSTLRKDQADSGRLLVHDPKLPASLEVSPERPSTPSGRVPDEAFIGLIRSQSKAIRKKMPDLSSSGPIAALRPGTPARAPTPAQQPPPPPRGDSLLITTAALKEMLPDTVPDSYGLSQHAKANAVKTAIDGIPDAFGFIHEIVVSWDRENRIVRKRQDDERSVRQADSEQRIDDLFNDNEIGYADIGDLEAEYKLAEAEKKYQEDQQELDSFTKGVYMPVTERLQKELAQLNAQYTIAIDLLDLESESASRMFKSASSKAEMGFVMTCMLSLFNKLEMRHQKIAEANVERERRRKRLELTVLYTNGDTAGVKSLEAEFAVAEKMQVLHEARGRDTRANKLMDTFDRATVRGLGDNQTYVDDLLLRIREVKELVLKSPNDIPESVYEPDGPRDALSLAQKAIDFVLADSQKLLTISNVADKSLNDADFGVSVAEARVSNADVSTHEKLASEKEREDEKIAEDTNSRMASIARGPEEASALIREVVDRVGDDPLHKERMKAALEAAKRRNADKEAGSPEGMVDG